MTAGPTREFFDSVRFISNPSTGKMGYAVAIEAARRGHDVVLITGPVDLLPPDGMKVIHVLNAGQMLEACVAEFHASHAAVMTAAVCDYRPARCLPRKLKKRNRPRTVRLLPTTDILSRLAKTKGARVVVGFAMEDHDEHQHAEDKLRRKRCDAIVLNGPGNVGSDDACIQILRHDIGWCAPQSGTKAQMAVVVMDTVEHLLGRPLTVPDNTV
ncbi:MAG: phosphopantothenoylcysteine decarboxylase [Phycisphaerae bacterium]